jgi:hypothetical protein
MTRWLNNRREVGQSLTQALQRKVNIITAIHHSGAVKVELQIIYSTAYILVYYVPLHIFIRISWLVRNIVSHWETNRCRYLKAKWWDCIRNSGFRRLHNGRQYIWRHNAPASSRQVMKSPGYGTLLQASINQQWRWGWSLQPRSKKHCLRIM